MITKIMSQIERIVPERFIHIKLQFLALKVLAITSMVFLIFTPFFYLDIILYAAAFLYLIFPFIALTGVVLEEKKWVGIFILTCIALKIIGLTVASDFNNLITIGGAFMMPFLSLLPELFIIILYLYLSFGSSKKISFRKLLIFGSFISVFLLLLDLEFFAWGDEILIKKNPLTFSFVGMILAGIGLTHNIITKGRYRKPLIFIFTSSALIFLFYLTITLLAAMG